MGKLQSKLAILTALAISSAGAQTADAGVKGGEFSGTQTNSAGQSFNNVEDFGTNGSLHYVTDFGFDQTGTYTEYDLGLFSLWTGSVPQPENPAATLYGFSLLSYVTFVYVDNNIGTTSTGLLFKSGSAPSDSSPSSGSSGTASAP